VVVAGVVHQSVDPSELLNRLECERQICRVVVHIKQERSDVV